MSKYVLLPNSKVEVYEESRNPANTPCCGENRTEWELAVVTSLERVEPEIQEKLKTRNTVFD